MPFGISGEKPLHDAVSAQRDAGFLAPLRCPRFLFDAPFICPLINLDHLSSVFAGVFDGKREEPGAQADGETVSRNYDRVSSKYDRTIAVATGGQNLATRLELDEMQPGDRVLYVGVGSCEDAIELPRWVFE